MMPFTRWGLICSTVATFFFGFSGSEAFAEVLHDHATEQLRTEWGHQSMAWVLGPNSTSIRSPYEQAQPTGFTWSIVPDNTEAVYYAGGSVIYTDSEDPGCPCPRVTQDIRDLNAVGLDSLEDYKAVLESVIDAWADVSGIQNLGYVEETGSVLVGGVADILGRGPESGVGHIRFMAYDSPIIPTGVLASASYIPEPGVSVDNAYNRSRSGDVRFRSDANIWGQGSGNGFYFRKIAMHEVGHILGFAHNSVSGSVMGPGLYSELGLGEGDIEGAVAIYGPVIPEPTSVLLLLASGGVMMVVGSRRRLR